MREQSPLSRQSAKPGNDPQGRLRRRCAVAAQVLTAAAGLVREDASGRETYKGSTPPLASNGKPAGACKKCPTLVAREGDLNA